MTPDQIQTIILAILGGGLVSGIFSFLTKRSRSPESQNELARLGNDFATKLLEDARTERKELRLTIQDLEKLNETKQESIEKKQESIERLKALADEKDRRIEELEQQRQTVAQKLQRGEKITLADIFGKEAPNIRLFVDQGTA